LQQIRHIIIVIIPLLINLKISGFYRVNYDIENWQLLVNTLNDPDMMSSIHLMNRAQLMDDALALARANDLDYTTALDTTAYLAQETEFLPWASALSALGYLNDRLNYEQESRELFEV
jgi:aminopeptidase N